MWQILKFLEYFSRNKTKDCLNQKKKKIREHIDEISLSVLQRFIHMLFNVLLCMNDVSEYIIWKTSKKYEKVLLK